MKVVSLSFALLCLATVHAQTGEPEDVASIPSVERHAGGDADKTYFLIGHDEAAKDPSRGYKLLLILPGGNGGRDFEAFCRRIRKYALDDGWVAAQLVSKQWTDDQKIVWPTERTKVRKMEFSTEEFIDSVIEDVESELALDREFLFTLSWSSSGPACYAEALKKKSRITGSFIAMSVFKPDQLPSLAHSKKRAFYIYHSKDDKICPMRMAEDAAVMLEKHKAKVELATYDGGHGWRGPVWANMKRGITWLEVNHASAVKYPKPKRSAKNKR